MLLRELEINGIRRTQKLQRSKKKFERIRGHSRIIAPMAGAATAGAVLGVKDAKQEIKKTHAAGQIAPASSLYKDIKSGIKKVKEKFKKK